MSFSVSTDAHPAESIRQAIADVEPGMHLGEGQLRLLRQGKEQAIATLESGAVGDAGDPEADDTPATAFRVTISGHAAGDTPSVGDVLTVSVNQVPFESAAEP